jgi:flagellum-specific peptidoglycan hydrolase FlgJ
MAKHQKHHSVRHAHHIHHAVKQHALDAAHTTFIHSAGTSAINSEIQTGVPAAVTVAQAILESAWGKYHMGAANNYFGIKAQTAKGQVSFGDIATGYVDRSTKEHIKKTNKDITITAHFRSYADMEGSFRDHGMFLRNNPRYSAALAAYAKTGDANEFARGIQTAGYATDPHYAETLISIMKRYNLYRLNQTRPVLASVQEIRRP